MLSWLYRSALALALVSLAASPLAAVQPPLVDCAATDEPGDSFGAGGEGSIRICYAAERAILEPALERLTKFLRSGS